MNNSKVIFTMIGGKKYGLLYNIAATRKIGEISGYQSAMDWITAENLETKEEITLTKAENLSFKLCVILEALVNGYAEYVNATGGKGEFVPENYFLNTMCSAEIMKYQENIIDAIKKGIGVEIPESLAKNIDEDYVQIEASKKN